METEIIFSQQTFCTVDEYCVLNYYCRSYNIRTELGNGGFVNEGIG